MKNINLLGFMALFSLLSFIGIFTENKAFLGFSGFLFYLRYFTVIPDELFKDNVKKSASIGFFVEMATVFCSVAFVSIFQPSISNITIFVLCFIVSVFTFTISLIYYSCREKWGTTSET